MITSRKHSGEVSAADSAELEEIVFDLVRDRLLDAVGAGGMWTLQFRSDSDTDAIFGETIAEVIARDVAGRIAADHTATGNTAAENPANEGTERRGTELRSTEPKDTAAENTAAENTPTEDGADQVTVVDGPGVFLLSPDSAGVHDTLAKAFTGLDDPPVEIERRAAQLVA